jgi:ornithine cyclodeaminase/alanine dehydrogenase-like protein (mu-crystallin family)
MLILSAADVARALTMCEAIEAVRRGFIELSAGSAQVPLRASLDAARHDGVTLVMPGYLAETDALAVKVVSIHPRNSVLDLPLIHALVLVIEPTTGRVRAAIEGSSLTALRTGAASGLATELLARRDAHTAAIFGAGRQARTQLLAVCAVRPVRRVFICAPRAAAVAELIAEMQPQLPDVELLAASSRSEALREAEVICAATNSAQPVFAGVDLKAGAHINAIGAYQPTMREVDGATIARAAKIVVDERKAALAEAGDLLQAIDEGIICAADIHAEIGEIAAGRRPGRERDDEITYFKSVGNAAQDVAVAAAICARAAALALGVEVAL